MARAIRFRRRAAFDIESIVVYLGEVRHQPQSAESFYQELKGCLTLLAEVPTIGKPFHDDALDTKTMRWHSVGPYRVFYSANEESITVWRVIHERQELDDFALEGL